MSVTPPVFLVGCQRSGTTALALALEAAYAREGRIFTVNGKLPYVLHRWTTQADIDGLHLRSDEIVHSLTRRMPYGVTAAGWVDEACATVHRYARWLAADDPVVPRTLPQLIAAIVSDAYGAAGGWGDKYNEYLLDLDALIPFAPDAKLLLLVRDPAEVAASMVAWRPRREWCPTTVEQAQQKWVSWHERFLTHPMSARARTLVVDYAEFGSENVLRRVADFCELQAAIDGDALRPVRPTQAPARSPGADRMWSRLRELTHDVGYACKETR